MMLLRLFNVQGIAGLAVGLALAVLLVVQKGETRHWKKQAAQYQQLYSGEEAALSGTVANYRAAAAEARASDQAALERVGAEQRSINERTSDEFEKRLAAARADYQRLRSPAAPAADPGARGSAPVPALSAAPGGSAQAAGEGELSSSDALTATEQAIQLDELIKWVRQQHGVRVDSVSGGRPKAAEQQHAVQPNTEGKTR